MDGSMPLRLGGDSRTLRRQVVGGVALACVAAAALVALSGRAPSPAALFSLSGDELNVDNDAALQSLLNAPKMEARKYSLEARQAKLAAQKDSQMLATASQDELEATAVATKDKALLSGLYSGSFRTGDPSGIHTGALPTADYMSALEAFPQSQKQGLSGDFASVSKVTNTQLSGLQAELNTLNSRKQSIVKSLRVRRQMTAAKMAGDADATDHIRLGRAKATMSARSIRAAMRTVQMAEQRAKEASVIEANQNAIAKMELQRIHGLTGSRDSAIAAARASEAAMAQRESARRAGRDTKYHAAMSMYTQQTQDGVSDDMKTLGELRKMEEAAAPGPHLTTTRWQQAPQGPLADIDPDHFMGVAPFRSAESLRDFKQVAGSVALAAPQAKTSQLAYVKATGGKQARGRAGKGDSILRVMASADQELAQLEAKKKQASRPSRMETARLSSLSSKVDSQLQGLEQMAKQEGVSSASVEADAQGAAGIALDTAAPVVVAAAAAAAPADVEGDEFTSFPTTSARSVEAAKGDATRLDDGAMIRQDNLPVARMEIPLGGHQDASKGRAKASAPRRTIMDKSTEASAVRADGTHGSSRTEEKLSVLDGQRITHFGDFAEPVHMPHV